VKEFGPKEVNTVPLKVPAGLPEPSAPPPSKSTLSTLEGKMPMKPSKGKSDYSPKGKSDDLPDSSQATAPSQLQLAIGENNPDQVRVREIVEEDLRRKKEVFDPTEGDSPVTRNSGGCEEPEPESEAEMDMTPPNRDRDNLDNKRRREDDESSTSSYFDDRRGYINFNDAGEHSVRLKENGTILKTAGLLLACVYLGAVIFYFVVMPDVACSQIRVTRYTDPNAAPSLTPRSISPTRPDFMVRDPNCNLPKNLRKKNYFLLPWLIISFLAMFVTESYISWTFCGIRQKLFCLGSLFTSIGRVLLYLFSASLCCMLVVGENHFIDLGRKNERGQVRKEIDNALLVIFIVGCCFVLLAVMQCCSCQSHAVQAPVFERKESYSVSRSRKSGRSRSRQSRRSSFNSHV